MDDDTIEKVVVAGLPLGQDNEHILEMTSRMKNTGMSLFLMAL